MSSWQWPSLMLQSCSTITATGLVKDVLRYWPRLKCWSEPASKPTTNIWLVGPWYNRESALFKLAQFRAHWLRVSMYPLQSQAISNISNFRVTSLYKLGPRITFRTRFPICVTGNESQRDLMWIVMNLAANSALFKYLSSDPSFKEREKAETQEEEQ